MVLPVVTRGYFFVFCAVPWGFDFRLFLHLFPPVVFFFLVFFCFLLWIVVCFELVRVVLGFAFGFVVVGFAVVFFGIGGGSIVVVEFAADSARVVANSSWLILRYILSMVSVVTQPPCV